MIGKKTNIPAGTTFDTFFMFKDTISSVLEIFSLYKFFSPGAMGAECSELTKYSQCRKRIQTSLEV